MKKIMAAFAVLALMVSFTGCEFHSGLRIGYVGNSTGHRWKASYRRLDGRMWKTMRTDNDVLSMSVETEKGSIMIEVYDADKNLIYEASGAGDYELNADGKIKVVITADDHKGSFDIKIAEN